MKIKIHIGKREFGISLGLTTLLALVFALVGYIITGTLQGAAVGLVMPIMAMILVFFGLIPFVGWYFFDMFYNMFMNWMLDTTGLAATFAVPQFIIWLIYMILAVILSVAITIIAIIFIIGIIAAIANR